MTVTRHAFTNNEADETEAKPKFKALSMMDYGILLIVMAVLGISFGQGFYEYQVKTCTSPSIIWESSEACVSYFNGMQIGYYLFGVGLFLLLGLLLCLFVRFVESTISVAYEKNLFGEPGGQ